ncbi:hypothetical protein KUCAC02_008544 [Chaenocephalus aceratus]|uniref:Uncharacterized protein n=1 Tax=Chaenocephalus aceratus TaxID=36190 RepID=A0ACB9WQV7_CHAAC|nr:hypothetical protein KUCAC02_008544 [Chaenocephalus aceratus]
MAQGSYIWRNVSGHSTEECAPNCLGIDYSYHPDLDYIKCVDHFQNNVNIKRLSLKRRPKVAINNAEKSSSASTSQWYSAESLSSSCNDHTRLLGMSSTTSRRPPLPPPHGSSLDNKPHGVKDPLPLSPVVGDAILETLKHLEQEVKTQLPPQPQPRRRLASFGGVSSHGSLSPFTGLGAYNLNINGNKPTSTGDDMHVHLSSSLGSRAAGCLRQSPQSSGRTTPATGLGPMHLQHVRDQMVVALQRLRSWRSR